MTPPHVPARSVIIAPQRTVPELDFIPRYHCCLVHSHSTCCFSKSCFSNTHQKLQRIRLQLQSENQTRKPAHPSCVIKTTIVPIPICLAEQLPVRYLFVGRDRTPTCTVQGSSVHFSSIIAAVIRTPAVSSALSQLTANVLGDQSSIIDKWCLDTTLPSRKYPPPLRLFHLPILSERVNALIVRQKLKTITTAVQFNTFRSRSNPRRANWCFQIEKET